MKKSTHISVLFLIQIAIGFHFCISGIQGIMGFNSNTNQLLNDVNKLMGESPNYLPLIIAILFLLVGFILIIGVIAGIKNKTLYYSIFILWAIYLIMTYFTNDFLRPDEIVWLKGLSSQLIILAGIWGTTQAKK
jgi:uncharacterized membrane protein YphA (DoxX/SURF4 family)